MAAHSHLTTTEVSPDLGEFTEILDDVSVEMVPLRYRLVWATAKSIYELHFVLKS